VLDSHELDFLHAAHDLTARQAELYPVLAKGIGGDPYSFSMLRHGPADGWLGRLRDRWAQSRHARGRAGEWSWWFHGLECDMQHADGHFVRIDFGPTGQRLVLTGWGVLQYVMCAKPPWRTFETLRAHLAARPPPYNSLSGDHAKMSRICDRLQALALLVPARTLLGPDELTPGSMDFAVSHRLVLAPAAKELLCGRTR
jgi:hypothetical protein